MSTSSFGTITHQEETDESLETLQMVSFRLGEGDYGVDIKSVREINRLTNVTHIPTAPPFVEGIINLRGLIVPVVNLGLRFGLARTEHSKDTRVVVIESDGHTLGLVVDAVSEVLSIPTSEIDPASNMSSSGIDISFVEGVGKIGERLILILSPERLFSEEEKEQLAGLAEG